MRPLRWLEPLTSHRFNTAATVVAAVARTTDVSHLNSEMTVVFCLFINGNFSKVSVLRIFE